MSNLKQQIYRSNILALTKSIVFKNTALADLANAEITLKEPVTGIGVEEDPTTWRYYMNLAGEYHALDVPMTIVSLDTMEEIAFDKDTLFKHRATIKQYTLGSNHYNDLVARYPLQEDLIVGILNPVDMDTAIEAEDYTILNYDNTLIEPQESNLIELLQEFIYRIADRWVIKDFGLTDELYPVMTTTKIWQFIPSAIANIRLGNIKTYKAHSFHVWNYLDSHGELSKYRDYLSLSQTMWLYRNIKHIFTNAGKNETFEALMQHLLTERSIPLGSFRIRQSTEDMVENLGASVEAVRRPLNLHELTAEIETTRTIDYIFEKQLTIAKDNPSVSARDLSTARAKLPHARVNELPTKVYESSWINSDDADPYLLEDCLVNHWAWFAYQGRYTSVINVRNPYTNELMSITVEDAFVLWMWLVNKVNGVLLTEVPRVPLRRIRRDPLPKYPELRALMDAQGKKDVTDNLIDWFLDNQAVLYNVISTEAFNDMVEDIHSHQLMHHKLWTIQHDRDVRAGLEMICSKAYFDTAIDFYDEPKNYEQLFDEKGWDVVNLIDSDAELLIADIYNLSLGVDLTNTITKADIQSAMLSLMQQLGTYDSHYLQTINSTAPILLGTQAVRLIRPDNKQFHGVVVQPVSIDRVSLLVIQKHLMDLRERDFMRINETTVDITRTVHIGYEAKTIFNTEHKYNTNIDIPLNSVTFDWPNEGNLDDIVIEGDLIDIIVRPIDGDDLAELLPITDLNGLYFDEGLDDLIGGTIINGKLI